VSVEGNNYAKGVGMLYVNSNKETATPKLLQLPRSCERDQLHKFRRPSSLSNAEAVYVWSRRAETYGTLGIMALHRTKTPIHARERMFGAERSAEWKIVVVRNHSEAYPPYVCICTYLRLSLVAGSAWTSSRAKWQLAFHDYLDRALSTFPVVLDHFNVRMIFLCASGT